MHKLKEVSEGFRLIIIDFDKGIEFIKIFNYSWTRADMETACRQLGFQGGSWWSWVDRERGTYKPRMLYEQPRCIGTESSVFECQWQTRQLGSGVCGKC